MKWGWREGSRFSADPQAIGNAIEALGRKLGRPHEAITEEDVVQEATENPESVFRKLFDWDDASAAYRHRLEVARDILRSCRPIIVYEGKPKMVMGRVNVRIEGGPKAYVMMDKVARDKTMNDEAIRAARSGLEGWRDRMEQIAGFAKVLVWVDKAIAEIKRIEDAGKTAKTAKKKVVADEQRAL